MKDHLTVEGLSEPFTRTGKTNKCVESTVHNPFMNPSPFAPRDIGKSCPPLSSNSTVSYTHLTLPTSDLV